MLRLYTSPPTLTTLCPELLLHIASFLPQTSLASLSLTSHQHHSLLLSTLFSHLSLTPSPTNTLSHRIHKLAQLARMNPRRLCKLVRTASVDLGTAQTLKYEDFMELGVLLGCLKGLRRLRVLEEWEPGRLLGRGRLYGVWLEGILRSASSSSSSSTSRVAASVWPDLEELELVGVVGDASQIDGFLSELCPSLRTKRLAFATLVRIHGRFSTGQLAIQLELPSQPFHLYPDRFPSPHLLSFPSVHFEVQSSDPTTHLLSFLASLDGTPTVQLSLDLPSAFALLPKRQQSSSRESSDAEGLVKALDLHVPGLKTLRIKLGSLGSREVAEGLRKRGVPFEVEAG